MAFDGLRDRLTGAHFGVTAAGTQVDESMFNDSSSDTSWDAVWSSAVSVDDEGWTAEMRIPLSQLRFTPGQDQTWGLHLVRNIKRKAEEDWWAFFGKKESGLMSRAGDLTGLDLQRRRHLSLLPYATLRGEFLGDADPADPFTERGRGDRRRGPRPEVGRHEQPDARCHGQPGLRTGGGGSGGRQPHRVRDVLRGAASVLPRGLEHHPELRAERRHELLRVQPRQPHAVLLAADWPPAAGTGVRRATWMRRDSTTILSAAKLTGKTSRGWSLNLIDAVTAREHADVALGPAPAPRRGRAADQLPRHARAARRRDSGPASG